MILCLLLQLSFHAAQVYSFIFKLCFKYLHAQIYPDFYYEFCCHFLQSSSIIPAHTQLLLMEMVSYQRYSLLITICLI